MKYESVISMGYFYLRWDIEKECYILTDTSGHSSRDYSFTPESLNQAKKLAIQDQKRKDKDK